MLESVQVFTPLPLTPIQRADTLPAKTFYNLLRKYMGCAPWAFTCEDCTVVCLLLSQLAAADQSDRRPKIWIYDLPEDLHNHSAYEYKMEPRNFYSLDYTFPKILKASPYVTTNAEEADFFYVGLCGREMHDCACIVHACAPPPCFSFALSHYVASLTCVNHSTHTPHSQLVTGDPKPSTF